MTTPIHPNPSSALLVCLTVLVLPAPMACRPHGSAHPDQGVPSVSRSMALSAGGTSLWVVNPESDSISEIDVGSRSLKREILLGRQTPAIDPTTCRYEPAVRPRAIALVDALAKVYVAGQSANAVYVVDTKAGQVITTIPVGAEPTAVVASPDGSAVYVVNHESATVQKIDTRSDSVVATVSVNEHPWGASLRADGSLLYVSHLLLSPGVTRIEATSFAVSSATPFLAVCPGSTPFGDKCSGPPPSKLIPFGQPRGAYAAVPRPDDGEVWVPHMLLATNTAQPELDFQSTVFPTVTRLVPGGTSVDNYILFRPGTVPSTTLDSLNVSAFSFTDVASGPRDIAFTPDGSLALVAFANSENVIAFDAVTGYEVALAQPITNDLADKPVGLLEGIVIDSFGTHAYVQGRATHNVAILDITQQSGNVTVTVDGDPIECLSGADPMSLPPAGSSSSSCSRFQSASVSLRKGMRLFYTSNSAAFPVTQNVWVACANCHLEGQTDAVTWQFLQGPRDTPSNAGGPINTGFLFRQAVRNNVTQYDETIRVEQGGSYHLANTTQVPDLQALADFTNFAIPFPQNPHVSPDGTLTAPQQHGEQLFQNLCASCHSGAYFTDSGSGNPTLDLCNGTVTLHDIGTCVTTDTSDKTSTTYDGACERSACQFDTPTLRGIFATAPYFHDGSALTLPDAVARIPSASGLSAADQADLVAYLETL